MGDKAQEHNVTIELAEENCKELFLLCEESLLVRAIRNVVQNAIEAMPDGGIVGIQCLKAGDSVVIRVTDSGRGIDEQRLRYLGLPYYCTKEQGIGLGLMISSKIIQDHYGTIAIASELHRGTVVDITLPAYR
ncbi:ATP-binding protein [Paenibacillus silvisoli]|uniref:ATP-binding protein n=1 Tax=Paenibacillus silvisoli TaxID=3110539 RepID=UPI002804EC78|nr:ATP-binding protein [Paenibacillus silvisoli]